MYRFIAVLMFTAFVVTCQLGCGTPVRELTWDDLIPYEILSDDPLKGLNDEQRNAANWVVYMLENLPERNSESEEIYLMVDEAIPEFKEAGIDIAEIMEKRNKLYTSVVHELSGQQISIAGYLLPLEMSDSMVTEFFLVPYIGACIHVPPPPPNQILHVTVTNEKGYKSSALYDPVMVTGVIRVESSVKELFLVDGSDDIDTGYALEATEIKPYEIDYQDL